MGKILTGFKIWIAMILVGLTMFLPWLIVLGLFAVSPIIGLISIIFVLIFYFFVLGSIFLALKKWIFK